MITDISRSYQNMSAFTVRWKWIDLWVLKEIKQNKTVLLRDRKRCTARAPVFFQKNKKILTDFLESSPPPTRSGTGSDTRKKNSGKKNNLGPPKQISGTPGGKILNYRDPPPPKQIIGTPGGKILNYRDPPPPKQISGTPGGNILNCREPPPPLWTDELKT